MNVVTITAIEMGYLCFSISTGYHKSGKADLDVQEIYSTLNTALLSRQPLMWAYAPLSVYQWLIWPCSIDMWCLSSDYLDLLACCP
jgi:hypothetical protein